MNILLSLAWSALAFALIVGLPSHLLAQTNPADALVGVWEGTKLDGRNNQWDLFGPFEIEKDSDGIVVTYLRSRVGDRDHRMHEPTFKASSLSMQWGRFGAVGSSKPSSSTTRSRATSATTGCQRHSR